MAVLAPRMILEVSSKIQIEKPLVKNKNGFYQNVPLAVLDHVSRNKTLYESSSFQRCIDDPNGHFRKRLEQGVLFGEYDHPFLAGERDREKAAARFVRLDPDREAIAISAIRIGEVPNLGKVVFGDIKGSGPYGKVFEEKMSDPSINVAFSLRALTQDTPQRGHVMRKALAVITFDAGMAGGGFEEAAKDRIAMYNQSSEGMTDDNVIYVDFSTDNIYNDEFTKNDAQLAGAASECLLSMEDIERIYGKIEIKQGERIIGHLDANGQVIPSGKGNIRRSAFDTYFNS